MVLIECGSCFPTTLQAIRGSVNLEILMFKTISIIFMRLNHLIKTFSFAFLIFCWFYFFLHLFFTEHRRFCLQFPLSHLLSPFVSPACSISNSLCNNEGELNLIPGKVDRKNSYTTNQTNKQINKQPSSQPTNRFIVQFRGSFVFLQIFQHLCFFTILRA